MQLDRLKEIEHKTTFVSVEGIDSDVIDVFSKLNNEKQYQEMANDILSCFIVDSMKKER